MGYGGNKTVFKRAGSKKLKRRLFADKTTKPCAYCGKTLTVKTATLDHVKPLSDGGYNSLKNTQLACNPCNSLKGSKSLGEFKDYQWSRG